MRERRKPIRKTGSKSKEVASIRIYEDGFSVRGLTGRQVGTWIGVILAIVVTAVAVLHKLL